MTTDDFNSVIRSLNALYNILNKIARILTCLEIELIPPVSININFIYTRACYLRFLAGVVLKYFESYKNILENAGGLDAIWDYHVRYQYDLQSLDALTKKSTELTNTLAERIRSCLKKLDLLTETLEITND